MKISQILAYAVGYGGLVSLYFAQCNCLRAKILAAMYIIGRMKGGSEDLILYSLFGLFKPKYTIEGEVKPGYEKVREAFERNFKMGVEKGSQCCVYVKGEKVVDLVGKTNAVQNYGRNTFQIVYSSTKCLTSLVVAMFVDRGLIKYEQKISEIWPEFAQHGKENITIEDVLRHQAGLFKLKEEVTEKMSQLEDIQQNKVGKIIEDSVPVKYTTEANRQYHPVSRGFILNEVIRRVDPKKRTIGEIVQEEINQPLKTEFFIGIPQDRLKEVSDVTFTIVKSPLWLFVQSIIPKWLGSKVELNLIGAIFYSLFIIYLNLTDKINIVNDEFKMAQIPSINGVTNASSIAKIAALIANKGKLGNVQLISEKTQELFHSEPVVKVDNMMRRKSKFNKGGNNVYSDDQQVGASEDTYGFVGWQGMGGSVMNWHPELNIGFGYAMNLLDADASNIRGFRIRKAVYECVEQLNKNE